MMLEKLRDIIADEDYEFYGIRVDSCNKYNVGDTCENSHQWWQDDPEDGSEYNEINHLWDGGELDGTCCLEVCAENIESIIKTAEKNYFGNNVTLIAGDYAERGNDNGEIIISNATVLYVIR